MGFFDKLKSPGKNFDPLSSDTLKRTFLGPSKSQFKACRPENLRSSSGREKIFKKAFEEGTTAWMGTLALGAGAFSHLLDKPGRTDAPSAVSSPGTGSETSTRTQEAREQAILEAKQRRGMSSTVTTTPLGVTSFAGTSKKKLIGE